ncbi:MAG: helix-turn-helix domain-containing protein [Steroidobacteraceae bacterium]
MNLHTIGRQIGERRRMKRLTLPQLAATAGVSRSTLAALESGKLKELGFNRVVRLCAAVDLVVDVRAPRLKSPLMSHRHLTDLAGRELTGAAIDDVVTRGDVTAWRGLARAIRADRSGRLARRVRDVLRASAAHDPRARAFALMLPGLKANVRAKASKRG